MGVCEERKTLRSMGRAPGGDPAAQSEGQAPGADSSGSDTRAAVDCCVTSVKAFSFSEPRSGHQLSVGSNRQLPDEMERMTWERVAGVYPGACPAQHCWAERHLF